MTEKTFVIPLDGSTSRSEPFPWPGRWPTVAGVACCSSRWPSAARSTRRRTSPRSPRDTPHPKIETRVVDDRYPGDAIATVVGESADRVVCMTSHGRGGLRWGVVGSVAEEVIRHADRPTLVVGRNCRDDALTGSSHMLVCVDGSDTTAGLAPVASDWAERLKLDVHAAMVVHPLDVESAEHSDVVIRGITEQFGGPDHVTATMLTSQYPAGTIADYRRIFRPR